MAAGAPAPALRRRRRLLFLALVATLAWAVQALVPRVVGALAERTLSRFFNRPARVAAVRFQLLPLQADLVGVRVDGPTPASRPFLEVERVVVQATPAGLLAPGLELERVRVIRPRLQVEAYARGGDDFPRLGGGAGAGLQLHLGRVTLEQGELLVNHRRVPLDLDLPALRGRLAGLEGGGLGGEVSLGPGPVRFGQAEPLHLSSEIALVLRGRTLTVSGAHLRTERTDVLYTGELRLSPLSGEFQVRGPVDLGVLDRHVMRSGLGLSGSARYDGHVYLQGSRLSLKGRLEGTAGEFDGVAVPRYAGQVAWDAKGVVLHDLEVETLGGRARVQLEVPPAPGLARLEADLRGVDAEGLARALFGWGELGLAAGASGPAQLSWPRGRFRELSGRAELTLAERAEDTRTPLSGRLLWEARSGTQRFREGTVFATPETRVQVQGGVSPELRAELALDAESSDLLASDLLGQRLRRAVGTPEARPFGFAGRGRFSGHWRGTLGRPVYEGRFSGADVEYLGVRWGRAEWSGRADGEAVRSHSLVLRKGEGELWLDGASGTGSYGEEDAIDVQVRFQRWPAPDLLRALEWELDVQGELSGEARLSGRRSAPQGRARLEAASGRYYGVPFQALHLQSRFASRQGFAEGEARVGEGTLRFRGTASADGLYDGETSLEGVEVGALFPERPLETRPAGRLSGRVQLQGPLARPRLAGTLRSPHLWVGEEGLGALEASFTGAGDGQIALDAHVRSARVDLAVGGRLAARAPYAAELSLVSRETSVDPFLRALWPRLPPALALVASGELRLSGPLAEPARLAAEGTVMKLEVLLPEYPVRNQAPVRVRLQEGRATLGGLHLSGPGTDLEVQGSLPLLSEGDLDLSLQGAADLSLVGLVTRRLRGRGDARLALAVSGPRASPHLLGTLELTGAGLRLRGFPHGLEEVRGTVEFDERGARFQELQGTLGGGTVEVSGQASYGEGTLTSFESEARARGVSLRYPEGLKSQLDADLRVFGDAETQWATGTIDVRQALWTRRYDVASELLAARAEWEREASLREGVRLDLKVRAPGTLRVDNNLAALQARAELSLQGTTEAPVVLGRAEVERGRVYFQGNTYVIRRGALDFGNPHRIDPVFDIEAETRLRAYRVTLRMAGTLDRVFPTLTSDPPLTTVQILSLLAGTDEPNLTEAQTGQARLAATGAATLAAGRIAEEVGLERGAERYLGLSRFSIDPSIVKGTQTDPTARVTLGKRITPDLNVVYSQDLRGREERVFSVEYTLSDRFSLLFTRSEPGGVGFDVRWRRSGP